MAIYFERQNGDNCRIHAINNCFGHTVINRTEFEKYHKEFQSVYEVKLEDNYVNSGNWDRSNLLSYILSQKFGLTCFTLGQYELPRFQKHGVIRGLGDLMDMDLKRFFVCDKNHVWCVRYFKDQWVCIDSMRTPQITSLQHWEHDPSLTLIFPWTSKRSKQAIKEMRKLVRNRFGSTTKSQISRMIIQDLSKREPNHFDDHQTWIALFFKYLQMCEPGNEVVKRFKAYENTSKLDMLNALNNLPDLIHFILHYK